ncbi:hypothetical protein EZS27_007342 [termite gut metagenome]|uniref:Uncharacterized protein n=1 Tax=termite gut metagenome TaxID=433724 RepID=A0A5J4SG52_9ZZZZ
MGYYYLWAKRQRVVRAQVAYLAIRPASLKNPVFLSAKTDANETGEAMSLVSVGDFPNAVNNQAQVAVLAYITSNYNKRIK